MHKSRKISILHIITTLDVGGAEKHLLSLLANLDRARFQFTIVFLKGRGELVPYFECNGIRVVSLNVKGVWDISALARIAFLVKKGAYDIVHTHLPRADFFGTLGARLGGSKVIICTKHNEDQYFRNPFLASLARFAARFDTKVVVISDAVGRFMTDVIGIPREKISKIYYGIEVKAFSSRGTLRREYDIPQEIPLAGVIGRFEEQKGHRFVIQAIKKIKETLPQAKFVFAGRGALEDELRSLANRAGVETNIIFAGFRDDISNVISDIDVLILPSLWEGFGLVLLEAMAASKPVIATGIGAIPEVVEDGITGILVTPRDVEMMVTAVTRLLVDSEMARRLGKAGRARVIEHFGLQKMVREWQRLYEGLLMGV
jgi:glycosyltransferase involved in cell wall biosynthesis